MSLYGAFAKVQHFVEIADNAVDQHGILRTPTERRNLAFQNLTGNATILASEVAALQGLTATSTELNTVDGGSEVGTAGAQVTAVETMAGRTHRTVLTVAKTAFTVGDTASLGVGYLAYTFPAGAILVHFASFDIDLDNLSVTNDTPDAGLGTTQASGVITALGGTPAFENLATGQTMGDTNGTQEVFGQRGDSVLPNAPVHIAVSAGLNHTVYMNFADAWGNNADATIATSDGEIVLIWELLE